MTTSPYQYYSRSEIQLRPDVPGTRYFAVALSKSMFTYFEVEPHTNFPLHSHESEQITYVMSGKLLFEVDGDEIIVGPGEVIAIAGDVPHAVSSLEEPVTAVDSWAPVRKDYAASVE